MTSFEPTNSVFNITDDSSSFSISTPGFWRTPIYLPDGIVDKLRELLELRSQNGFELHVKEVEI